MPFHALVGTLPASTVADAVRIKSLFVPNWRDRIWVVTWRSSWLFDSSPLAGSDTIEFDKMLFICSILGGSWQVPERDPEKRPKMDKRSKIRDSPVIVAFHYKTRHVLESAPLSRIQEC